ncbi:hypothetical protein EfmAA818_32400 (plasmid) [Enterococcus faecium]|nr:hypothetical protein EfmAA818_32400 [Enterococcus faecium]
MHIHPTYFYVLFDNPILKKNKTKKLEGYHVCAFIFPMNEGRSCLTKAKNGQMEAKALSSVPLLMKSDRTPTV